MGRKISIDPLVYPIWVFLLLTVPLKLLLGWFGAAVCHELGHIVAQFILGGSVGNIRVGPTGALIEGEDLGAYKNALCVLAGPVIGAMPMIFTTSFPELALCSFLLTAYNLIPLFPLDGGRVLRMAEGQGRWSGIMIRGIEWAVIGHLTFMAFRYRTPVALFPLIPYLRENFLAKRRNSGYNRATIEMR